MWRRNIGFVFQQPRLLAGLTAHENVMLPLVPREHSLSSLRERAWNALAAAGLGDVAHRFPGDLSGGERQRLTWARAFAGSPSILLFDEPTSSQDDPGRRLLAARLHEYAALGAAVVVASHDAALPDALGRDFDHWSLIDGRLRESS
jgi:putative ABC transport system ATP-binding protein